MDDIFIALGAAAGVRRDAWFALEEIDTDPDGGSPMLADKLLGDAITQLNEVARSIVEEAAQLNRQRERLLRAHPESFR